MEKTLCKNLLTNDTLKDLLLPKDWNEFLKVKKHEIPLSPELANNIAAAIKTWAVDNGVTHYIHWFLPLTEKTAGKRVSFLDYENNNLIQTFEGKHLIKGETDASSFPNGGERLTFEARGYTVWDYNANTVIKELADGNKVLLIPTAFCSYHGTALDEKTPLLRAVESLNKNAVKVMQLLGYKNVNEVVVNVGGEQEYFLIEKQYFQKRPDLLFTGRTLFGASPVKSQENHRNYFGNISHKVNAFMQAVNKKLWNMGIIAKLEHNEVAPCQYEIVPIYSQVNTSCDQNHLIMQTLQEEAKLQNLEVLLHEKPFNHINGSGKHTNWSLATNNGLNLLDASIDDQQLFLLFFTSVISAIAQYEPLLKLSATNYKNALRLGGDEAPPAIISVFVGQDLQETLQRFMKSENSNKKEVKTLTLGVTGLPKPTQDNCDRNRTSPFAFTGNKFEFRMVGSGQPLAWPNTILCAIVSQKLNEIAKELEGSNNKQKILEHIIKNNIRNSENIIFNGNGYTTAWAELAKERGLNTEKDISKIYKLLTEEKYVNLLEKQNILSLKEIQLRQNILFENYIQNTLLEANCMQNMLTTQILPALQETANKLFSLKPSSYQQDTREKINSALQTIFQNNEVLSNKLVQCHNQKNIEEECFYCQHQLLPLMQQIRKSYDNVENLIPKNMLPFPTYNDILYNHDL